MFSFEILSSLVAHMRLSHKEAEASETASFVDCFSDPLPSGRVIGSHPTSGARRAGIDKEGILGIDNGALRIQPLIKPGWGRSGIAYGPFQRENGLAFTTLLLNGHNISRTEPLPDNFRMRIERWARGSEVEKLPRRLFQWVKYGHKGHMWRRLAQWVRSGTRLFYWPWIEENLAVGWFPSTAPEQPLRQGCSLLMHAIVQEGGELWARVGNTCTPTVRGVQNIPFAYTIVLREKGAAYYASSLLADSNQEHLQSQLLAIDAFNADENLYAGVHQSVLGEIGFRADTRVYGAQVERVPQWAAWYGSAHGADSLTGDGPLLSSAAEVGGTWRLCEGEFNRTARGLVGASGSNLAALKLAAPSGLAHLLIDCRDKPVKGVALVWRVLDENNFWCFEVGSSHAQLSIVEDGCWHRHPTISGRHLPPNTLSSLQVFDDGEAIRISVNGNSVYGATLHDNRLRAATGVGIRSVSADDQVAIRSFEAHPREIHIPCSAKLKRPRLRSGGRLVARDQFEGPPGDLHGHRTTEGSLEWRRGIGQGAIELTGHGSAKVKGSPQSPCPGRTAYMIDWSNPEFADIEVSITPPGQRRGTREKGRSGLILWMDPENYITLSAFVEDWPAMSIAAFFKIGGFEELFDAVWSNVGSRMHWGEPHDFRLVFDGQQFMAQINREPVLYRAMTDVYPRCGEFHINKVGLVSNWEWGNDTGTAFQNFVGRDCQ